MMSPLKTGRFIALKRKEHMLTQEQLAERINVSGKTISKWECGKCMPDSAVMEDLCSALEISLTELLNGEMNMDEQRQNDMEKCVIQAMQAVERLEKEKYILLGFLLTTMGIALMTLSQTITGAHPVAQFFAGFALSISIAIMLLGIFLTVKYISRNIS